MKTKYDKWKENMGKSIEKTLRSYTKQLPMKNKPKCPNCNHELNLGSLMVQVRWAKTKGKKRREVIDKLNKARKAKKRGVDN